MSDRAKTFLLAAAAPALFVALLPLAAVQTRGSRSAVTTVPVGPATEHAWVSVMSTIVVSAHRRQEEHGLDSGALSRAPRAD